MLPSIAQTTQEALTASSDSVARAALCVDIAVAVILFVTLIVVWFYTYYTKQLVDHNKLPAVSCCIHQESGSVGQLRFIVQNHTPHSVLVTVKMDISFLGEKVVLGGVYSAAEPWGLMPKQTHAGAARLLPWCIENRFPELAKALAGQSGGSGLALGKPADEQMEEIRNWERDNDQPALRFRLKLLATTLGTRLSQPTVDQKWYYEFTGQRLVLDV